jgi:MFS family permease
MGAKNVTSNKLSFYLIVISQGISSIGGTVMRFAISLHVLDLTGSAEAFATMVAIAFLPMVLFQPVGGALADRFSKKMLLVISDSVNTALAMVLAILLFGGSQSVFILGAVVTLLSAVSTVYHPTTTAALPAILEPEELPKANGIIQGLKAIAVMAGPILAGFLFGLIGVNNLVAVCAIIFLFSAIINIFIKIPYIKQEKKSGHFAAIVTDLKEGFVYMVKESKPLFRTALIFAGLIFFFQSMLSVTLPYTIRIGFAMSEQFFGFANAGIGAAILLASLLAGKLKNFLKIKYLSYYIVILAIATIPVAISVLISPENIIIPFILLTGGFMLLMFTFTLLNILVMTHAQTQVPAHMVGKTIGILFSISNIPAPIGQFTLGRLIESLGDAQFIIYFSIAVMTLIIGVVVKIRARQNEPMEQAQE